MTREEAIEEINKVFEPAFANYIITALTEGVTASDKALKQEPCEDAVSRAEVKRIVEFYKEQEDGIFRVNESIDDLPSVQPMPVVTYPQVPGVTPCVVAEDMRGGE